MSSAKPELKTDELLGQQLIRVVIPVHNEEDALADDLRTIEETLTRGGYHFEIVVVDDGSTDRSAEIARNWPGIKLVQHPENRGTGAALKSGILKAKGDIIIMTDADGTYPNQDMPLLLSFMDRYDMVVGARTKEKGTMPWLRAPAKLFIRKLASYMVRTKIPDLNSGLRAFRKVTAVKFFNILPSGHSWVSTITLAHLANGYSVKYVPIDYFSRKGKSHFHPIRDTYNYLQLVVRTIMYFDPLRVFLPIAGFLLVAGGAKVIYDIIRYDFHLAGSTLMIVLTAIQLFAIGLLADLIVRKSRP